MGILGETLIDYTLMLRTIFAVGTTKFAEGISSEERARWRRSRRELLASVLGENSAFPTRVPAIRLSELENLRRTTNDPIHVKCRLSRVSRPPVALSYTFGSS
jgi:hypothetical protein